MTKKIYLFNQIFQLLTNSNRNLPIQQRQKQLLSSPHQQHWCIPTPSFFCVTKSHSGHFVCLCNSNSLVQKSSIPMSHSVMLSGSPRYSLQNANLYHPFCSYHIIAHIDQEEVGKTQQQENYIKDRKNSLHKYQQNRTTASQKRAMNLLEGAEDVLDFTINLLQLRTYRRSARHFPLRTSSNLQQHNLPNPPDPRIISEPKTNPSILFHTRIRLGKGRRQGWDGEFQENP